MSFVDSRRHEPIAVVGIGCRFCAGVKDATSLWQFLLAKRCGITEVPPQRWNKDRYFRPQRAPGRSLSAWGGFIEGVDRFDHEFFGISPREAESMDPQQRLLLEVSREAIDDAGISLARLRAATTGVFLGVAGRDYSELQTVATSQPHSATGMANSITANRLSYVLDLRGPSLAVDTACSSGLMAVHLACNSLWRGESELALSGAVNLTLGVRTTVTFSAMGMLSASGRCHAFDSRADGFVRAEGVGVLLLRPLSQAQQNGDRIYGLILDSAVNQDGHTSSLTIPSLAAQQELLKQIYQPGQQLDYLEAHGTGTPTGDPIEARAIGELLGLPERPLPLGSVKCNLGHTETASGVAGLIKGLMILRHRTIPGHPDFREPNPSIPLAELGLCVPTENRPLTQEGPLRVGVNSFGFGGSNAHVLLGEAPLSPPSLPPSGPFYFPVSAHSEPALRQRLTDLAEACEHALPADLAHALSRTEPLRYRRLVVAESAEGLKEQLVASLETAVATPNTGARVAFVFCGQGSQWARMACTLWRAEPQFRQALEACDHHFKRLGGWSLLAELERTETRLHQTEFAQPAIFAVQAGLLQLLSSWGVSPQAAVGHSMGEVAAAYAAGSLELEQACYIIFHRARAMQTVATGGAMLAAGLGPEELDGYLVDNEVAIAAYNSPGLLTLSGTTTEIAALQSRLEEEGRFCRRLNIDYGFHSPLMEPVRTPLLRALAQISARPARLPLLSTVSGEWEDGSNWNADYHWRNVRGTVKFEQACRRLLEAGFDTFVEVGPHPVLASSLEANAAHLGKKISLVSTLKRDQNDRESMNRCLEGLFQAGYPVNWTSLCPGQMTSLPVYPWQGKSFWLESKGSQAERLRPDDHPLLGARMPEPQASWQSSLRDFEQTFLGAHRFQQRPLYPAAGFLEMALAAAAALEPDSSLGWSLERVRFERALFIDEQSRSTRFELDDEGNFSIYSEGEGYLDWSRHCSGGVAHPLLSSVEVSTLQAGPGTGRAEKDLLLERPSRPPECAFRVSEDFTATSSGGDCYQRLAEQGFDYGAAFRVLKEVEFGEGRARARLHTDLAQEGYLFHPVLLDGCLQLAGMLRADPRPAMPTGVHRLRLRKPVRGQLEVRAWLGPLGVDLEVSAEGESLATLEGIAFSPLEGRATLEGLLYQSHFVAEPLPGDPAPLPDLALTGATQLLPPPGWQTAQDSSICLYLAGDGSLEEETLNLLEVLQNLAPNRQFRLVTRGAFSLPEDEEPRLQHAALLGMVRVLASEQPSRRCRVIDLSRHPDPGEWEALRNEVAAADGPTEVAWRGSSRYRHRIERLDVDQHLDRAVQEQPCYRLSQMRPGSLERLITVAASDPSPGDCEVKIRNRFASLNFSDVLKALDLYPGTPGGAFEMGLEFAGEIVEVGSEVAGLEPGDLVMGIAPGGAFRSHLNLPAGLLCKIPSGLSPAEAATLPVAYLTALHALRSSARLAPDETVLIHSASGGVGLAAIALARHLGARVLATAGSEEKREFLRNVGVEAVFDSRSLDFVAEVRAHTRGRGVDVVLNSLAGEALQQGVELLAPGGRFVELGKRDIYQGNRLCLWPFRNNLQFGAVDLEQLIREQPDSVAGLLAELTEGIEQGWVKSLPFEVTSAAAASQAFRRMAAAQHRGRLLLEFEEQVAALPEVLASPGPYLLSGGLGGLASVLARWLVERGARHLVLLGRRRPTSEELAALDPLRAQAQIDIVECDVAAAEQVAKVVEGYPRLAGVFHLAAVFDDALLENTTAESLLKVLRPKAVGGWNLHLATREKQLDCFLMFGSVAGACGNPGQLNYAAANSFLDGLHRLRRKQGLCSTLIDWGALQGAGHLNRHPQLMKRLRSRGIIALRRDEFEVVLEMALRTRASRWLAARLDWNRLGGDPTCPWGDFVSQDETEGSDFLESLRRQTARILGIEDQQVDPERPLAELGLDSLMAFELRRFIEDSTGSHLPPEFLLEGPSLQRIADALNEKKETTPNPVEDPIAAGPGNGRAGKAVKIGSAPPASETHSAVNGKPEFLDQQRARPQERLRKALDEGYENPWFQTHLGIAGPTTQLGRPERELINFSSYNYLGLCGHPEVSAAAIEAIHQYGTSVSASRVVAGERPVHLELEAELADFLGTEACLTFVSGHATNVTTIAHLMHPGDLILHDALIHDSVIQGALASRAVRRSFPHNRLDKMEAILQEFQGRGRRLLVVVEGLYSMDGDAPDLEALLRLQRRYHFMLMVDEAHSIGVLGPSGAGLAEACGVSRAQNNTLWMGTLSKALASCGGFLAADSETIEAFKYSLPGFVYSVGMPPATAASALAALRVLRREPERVERLRQRSALLRRLLSQLGCDLGDSREAGIVPWMVGSSYRAGLLSLALAREGVHVCPIVFPAVPEDRARLRFFVSSEHTEEQLEKTAEAVAKVSRALVHSKEPS